MTRPFWRGGLANHITKVIKTIHSLKPDTQSPPISASSSDTETETISTDVTPTASNMGGKSNKFDFTNRLSSGVKLGKSIGTALEKEAEKVKREADRHAAKIRKQSSDSSAGTSDSAHDAVFHLIDLKAPSKQLGDEGVCALADGLEIALESGTANAALALEDLNLADNNITTASLARLSCIIRHAKHDLKTLNLSNNAIEVTKAQQAQQWEDFLQAFGECYKMRRLDLSNNVGLSADAMEILARVHAREPAITAMSPGGEVSVVSLPEHPMDDETTSTSNSGINSRDSDEFDISLAHGAIIKRRCGLRSIPYITLQNVGLTDAGALWLSYILEDHHLPTQLIDRLNATDAGSQIKTYQQDAGIGGIDYEDNDASLGKEGLAVLRKTETVRKRNLLDETDTMSSSALTEGSEPPELAVCSARKSSRASISNRRVSIRSVHTDDSGTYEQSELDSARKKMQRHIIDHDGPKTIQLWHAALNVVACSRKLLRMVPEERKWYTGATNFRERVVAAADGRDDSGATSPSPTIVVDGHAREASAHGLAIDVSKANSVSSEPRRSYAATLAVSGNAVPGEPELALTSVTTSPVTPKMKFTAHRKGAFSEGSDMSMVTEKLDGLVVRDDRPERFLEWQEKCAVQYRDESIECHLTQPLLDKIMMMVLDETALKIMSEEQRRAAYAWGQDRTTLATGLGWMAKTKSAQVWMLLDSINCLAYGQ